MRYLLSATCVTNLAGLIVASLMMAPTVGAQEYYDEVSKRWVPVKITYDTDSLFVHLNLQDAIGLLGTFSTSTIRKPSEKRKIPDIKNARFEVRERQDRRTIFVAIGAALIVGSTAWALNDDDFKAFTGAVSSLGVLLTETKKMNGFLGDLFATSQDKPDRFRFKDVIELYDFLDRYLEQRKKLNKSSHKLHDETGSVVPSFGIAPVRNEMGRATWQVRGGMSVSF